MVDQPSFDIFNHYEIQKILATKEISLTYVASALDHTQHQVVVKQFNRAYVHVSQDDQTSKQYLKTLLSLHHQWIVPLLDIVLDDTQLYLVNAYLPHGSLRQRLQELPSRRMEWREALIVILKIGQALVYAHSQEIIHGKIKPENVLYKDGDEVMLADFSLTHAVHFNTLVPPIPHYMAPEQFLGVMSHRSDQYALACLAYELLVGHPPFEAQRFTSMWDKHANETPPPLAPLVPHVPSSVIQAILKALAKDPQQRYPDMATFLLELESGPNLLSLYTASAQEPDRVSYTVETNTSFSHLSDTHAPKRKCLAQSTAMPRSFSTVLAAPEVAHSILPQPSSTNETMIRVTPSEWKHLIQTTPPAAADANTARTTPRIDGQQLPSKNRTSSQFSLGGRRLHQPLLGMTFLLVAAVIAFSLVSLLFSQLVGPSETKMVAAGRVGDARVPLHTSKSSQSPIAARSPRTVSISPSWPTASPTDRSPILSATTGTPDSSTGIVSLRINTGGNGAGSFISDTDYVDPTLSPCDGTDHEIDTSLVSDPAPQTVYQDNRCAPHFAYILSRLVPTSTYNVRLHFAETYWTHPGQRVFTVLINDQPVLVHFDIVAVSGGRYRAIVEQFITTSTNHGQITIAFSAIRDNALVSGLEVVLAT